MDYFRRLALDDLRKQINQLRRNLNSPNPSDAALSEVERLQAEIGELRLYVAVLFRLLFNRELTNLGEVTELLKLLDAADGQEDQAFEGDVITGEPAPRPDPGPEEPQPNLRVI
jgi:hypothetical protein